MKIRLSAALVAVVILGGCAAPQSQPANQQAAGTAPTAAPVAAVAAAPGAAPAATTVAAATPDQAQADAAAKKKKKCSDSTGSRLGNCGGGSGDYVQGENGDSYRAQMSTNSNAMTAIPH